MNSVKIDTDSAELTLYGDVVTNIPVDWWTGEPLEGLFISLQEFLNDLDQIKDKKNITIRINSYGGEVYAGLAIHNRLKELTGYKTVIVDGIAASAASLIAMAADTIKMPASATMMIHNPLSFMYGYYNESDIDEVKKVLEHLQTVSAETYVSKTGKSLEDIREIMAAETWLSGREAVDQGFADELVMDKEPEVKMSADKKYLFVNGIRQDVSRFKNIPNNIPLCAMKQEEFEISNEDDQSEGGNEELINTVEDLRAEYPELVNQVETTARESARVEGATAERERIREIENIEDAVGDETLVQNAKYGEKPLNAAELAYQSMQHQAKLGTKHLENVKKDNEESGVQGVTASPNGGPEENNEPDESEYVNMIVGDKGKGAKKND